MSADVFIIMGEIGSSVSVCKCVCVCVCECVFVYECGVRKGEKERGTYLIC